MDISNITAKDVYKWISCWQSDMDESFIEYFIDNNHYINIQKFVMWLYHTGNMTLGQLQSYIKITFEAENSLDEISGEDLFFGDTGASILNQEIYNWEVSEYKALQLLADYLASNKSGIEKVYKFVFEGEGWSSNISEEDRRNQTVHMNLILSSWKDGLDDDYDHVKSLSIQDIMDYSEQGEY